MCESSFVFTRSAWAASVAVASPVGTTGGGSARATDSAAALLANLARSSLAMDGVNTLSIRYLSMSSPAAVCAATAALLFGSAIHARIKLILCMVTSVFVYLRPGVTVALSAGAAL